MRPIPQRPPRRPPRSQSNLAAALFILTLPLLAYSSASAQDASAQDTNAQDASPATRHQGLSLMLGSGEFRTDLGADTSGTGTSDDVKPISLSYEYNFTERHGILVLSTLADLEEVPEFPSAAGEYSSFSVLYKATFPTKIEKLKPYVLVGLSSLSWNVEVQGTTIYDHVGVGLGLGLGIDYEVLPYLSLRLLFFNDLERDTQEQLIRFGERGTRRDISGDIVKASASALNFGVVFKF